MMFALLATPLVMQAASGNQESEGEKLAQSVQSESLSHGEVLVPNNGPLAFEKQYKISKQMNAFVVGESLGSDEQIHLELVGLGEVEVSLNTFSGQEGGYKIHTVTSGITERPSLVPFDAKWFQRPGANIQLQTKDSFGTITATFYKRRSVSLKFGEVVKTFNFWSNELRLQLSMAEDLKSEEPNRLQFILQSSLNEQPIKGTEELEFYINHAPMFPTRNSYQAKASGYIGTGLIKTIVKSSAIYCNQPQCTYHVTIYNKDVETTTFLPTILPNGSTIKFDHTLSLLEEIEIGEQVEYVLQVPLTDDNWVFSIMPIEGGVQAYINPDRKEARLLDYKYRATSHRAEEVLITKFEAKAFKFQGDRFYVAFKSLDESFPATFKFEAKRLPSNMPVPLRENFAATGVVAHSEIVNYNIDLASPIAETVSVEFKLESFHGSSDLYVKECLSSDQICQVTRADIDTQSSAGRIFRLSKAERNGVTNKNDFVLLQFNCARRAPSDIGTLSTKYPHSETCRFAIGVDCSESTNSFGTYYKLTAYGRGLITDLGTQIPNVIRMYPKDRERFRVYLGPASDNWDNRLVFFRFTVLTGKFKAYFSTTDAKPDQGNNDLALDIENDNYSTVHAKSVNGSIPLRQLTLSDTSDSRYLYLSVEAQEYCNFELEIKFSMEELADSNVEQLFDKRITHRMITENSIHEADPADPKKLHYARRFVYTLAEGQIYSHVDSKIKIHISSVRFGIEICARVVQKGQSVPKSKECDFHSNNELLSIPKGDPKMANAHSVIIDVVKVYDPATERIKLPIPFTIKIDDSDSYEHIDLMHPGVSVTSTLNPGISQDYMIDLGHVNKNFGIFYSSVDPGMVIALIALSGESRVGLGALSPKQTGYKIHNIAEFKSTYCPVTDCRLFVSIFSHSTAIHRYSLIYTLDNLPIKLKDSEQLRLPNNHITWYLYEPDGDSPISFSVHDQNTQSQIIAKLLEVNEPIPMKTGTLDELLKIPFDFKSDIDKDPQIVIPLSFLRAHPGRKLLFVVRPVLDVIGTNPGDVVEFYSTRKILDVHLHSKVLHLTGFHQFKGNVAAGEFVYYYFNLDTPGDFSVILTVLTGDAVLYLHKDAGQLPSLHRFWRKSSGAKSDEIIVTKDDLLALKNVPRQFYVGVYGKDASRFKVLLMPDFKNLVHVRFQSLNEFELDPNQKYYFAYTNVKSSYDTLLYSEGGDIEVSALNYDDITSNFIDMVTDEANFFEKFTFKKGSLPRKKHFENVAELDTHTIVRVKALDSHCSVFFAIYDAQKPIEIPTESPVIFTSDKGDKRTFVAKLGASYDMIEISFKLEFGSVTVRYASNLKDLENASPVKISIPGLKIFDFKATGLERANDILIFKETYVEVVSSEFSRFDINIKPKEKFQELRTFETEIVQGSRDSDVYAYYTLTPKALKSTRSITIDYQCQESFRERPELLFISDAEVVLNQNSPFIPMPMQDLSERVAGDYFHMEVKPEPQPGSYVLKIPQSPDPHPIRISISINGQRSLSTNGVYHGTTPAPGKSHEYSMYLPEEGEYRIAIESCEPVEIESATFHGKNSYILDRRDFNIYEYEEATGLTKVTFNKNFRQPEAYLKVIKQPFKTKKEMRTVLLNIKRGFVSSDGLLRFNVTSKSAGAQGKLGTSAEGSENVDSGSGTEVKYTGPGSNTYLLMTEFRPFKKELVLKDYIKIPTTDKIDSYVPIETFRKDGLVVAVRSLTFIPQLLVDYPHLHTVTIKLHAYLFSDPEFPKKFQDCGLACFTQIPHAMTTTTSNLTREMIVLENPGKFDGVLFNLTQVRMFSSSETLNVFVMASVHFYNSDAEAHQVSKNSKYTTVPLVFVQFANHSQSWFSAHWGMVLLLGLTMMFLVGVYLKIRRSSDDYEVVRRPGYDQVSRGNVQGQDQKGGYTRPNQSLEMSGISMREEN